MQLTQEQNNIIHHTTGHAKVSAVAGSGKTTAMVARVRHLLQQGVAPDEILILMFNRSARDAFADKLRRLLQGSGLRSPEVRTFHSLGLRLIKSFTARNILPAHKLLTQEFQMEKLAREAVKKHAAEAGGNEQWWSRENMEGFILFIDLVKAHTDPAQAIFDGCDLEEQFSYYVEAYAVFESMRIAAQVRFFADLIHEPVAAIRQDKEHADWVANNVDHIIVDEYQDINEVQQQLIRHIAGSRAQVMVVGDVDQCIYEWRGAKPEYIISRFGRDFPDPASYTLSYTFRYGHRLALAANHLIRNNKLRDRKLCLARPENPDTRIHWLKEKDLHPIVTIINSWQEQGRSLSEAAALVRIYAQSVPVELALLEHSIPYRLVGHDTVFSCVEIMALLGYLHLCQGSLGEMGDLETGRAIVVAMLTNPHLWLKQDVTRTLAGEIVNAPTSAPGLIRQYAAKVDAPWLATRMLDMADSWQMISNIAATTPAANVLDKAIDETELFDHYIYASRPASAENKIKTCNAFIRFARRGKQDVNGFLAEIRQLAARVSTDDDNALLITSIHRAKGLQWSTVILPGLEDGVVPFRQDEDEEEADDIEDERRLFYVAITRASEQLFLIHPKDDRLQKRMKKGDCRSPDATEEGTMASCFLYEANLEFSDCLGRGVGQPETVTAPLRADDIRTGSRYIKAVKAQIPLKRTGKSSRRKPDSHVGNETILTINELAEGVIVRHPYFGSGIVTEVDRQRGVVSVEFDQRGIKKLVINVARLQNARSR